MRTLVAASLVALFASPAMAMDLTSPDLQDGQSFPQKFICTDQGGQNVSPALAWSAAPAGAKSFAVTMHDPDAPMTGGFWHWLVVDIPATATGLDQNAGAQGGALPSGSTPVPNGAKQAAYLGPCPPAGAPHHYEITVWALPTDKADVTTQMSPGDVGAWLDKNAIDKARIVPVYGHS